MVNASPNSALPADSPAAVLDPVALARLEELDPTRANDLLGRVLKAFQSSAARLMPQLDTARHAGDHATVRLVAHTLKSSSASIGALALSALCADIERLLRAGDNAAAGALLDPFHAEVHRVDAAVGQTLQHLEAAAS